MTGGFSNILYYVNTVLWILGWILVAVAAGVGAARSGRRILIAEVILAGLLALMRIANFFLADPGIGLLRRSGSPFGPGGYSDFQNWTTIYGLGSVILFAGFCTCLAIDRFTLPRPQMQSFPLDSLGANSYHRSQ